MDKISKLIDSKNFGSISEVIGKVREIKCNAIHLDGDYELRFHQSFRSFVVVRVNDPSSEYYFLCPVKSCKLPSPPGHRCVHWLNFIKEIEAEKETTVQCSSSSSVLFANKVDAKGISSLLKTICKKRGLDFARLPASRAHLSLLESLGKKKFSTNELTVMRYDYGMSLRVVLANGTMFFTCGVPGCKEAAYHQKGATYYCNVHQNFEKSNQTPSTNALETLAAFKMVFTTLASKYDPNVVQSCIPEEVWIRILAEIHEEGEFIYEFNGARVYVSFASNGQLTYKNRNKKKNLHKCPIPNCLSGARQFKDKFGRLAWSPLCSRHEHKEALLARMVKKVKEIVTERKTNARKSTANSSSDDEQV